MKEMDVELYRDDLVILDERSLKSTENGREQSCKICNKKLCSPRMLSCLHVFCEACIDKLEVNKFEFENLLKFDLNVECPICKQETKISGGDAASLPSYVLTEILDMSAMNQSDVCTCCKSKELAMARCTDCSHFLCANCKPAHFENHHVVPLDALQSSKEKSAMHRPIFCSEPLSPTTSAEGCLDTTLGVDSSAPGVAGSACRGVKVSAADADVRPSTSGLTGVTSKPVARRENQGSDLDTTFDDEFDVLDIETTALVGPGRDIPDDEELEEPVRDIIHVVERAIDNEADRLLGVSASFEWEEGFESFRGVPETFSGPLPGPLFDYDVPYDAFTDIWTKDIMQHIAQETNRYAKRTIDAMKAKGTLKPTSRLYQWTDTDADEIAVLFAVISYMGIDGRPSQDEYWKNNDFLEMPRFKEIMTYNRYLLLNKFLFFVDNSNVSQNLSHDAEFVSPKLAKLQPVISHLNCKFSSLYFLQREISIDESLTLFKGRLSFVQAIRSKAARFGIKSYELCEAQTGYLYKFRIYSGKDSGDGVSVAALGADLGGKTTRVVLDLLKDLERRGHCVTMDNFYNCPSLARYLKYQGFDCLGTLRTNRKHVPNDITKIPKNVAKGEIIARQCGDVSIIAWKDSKLVTMISTYHKNETFVGSKAGKKLVKPVCVGDYNKTMGGVVLKDQKLSMYLLDRKRHTKWHVNMFKRLLNVSIHNAFVMYASSLRRRTMHKHALTHRQFRYALAKSLVEKHRSTSPAITEQVSELTRLKRNIVHEPQYLTGAKNRKRCRVCLWQGRQQFVHSRCVTCEEFLCFKTCWREWHSLRKLKGKKPRTRTGTHDE